jgi:hypothetical protein
LGLTAVGAILEIPVGLMAGDDEEKKTIISAMASRVVHVCFASRVDGILTLSPPPPFQEPVTHAVVLSAVESREDAGQYADFVVFDNWHYLPIDDSSHNWNDTTRLPSDALDPLINALTEVYDKIAYHAQRGEGVNMILISQCDAVENGSPENICRLYSIIAASFLKLCNADPDRCDIQVCDDFHVYGSHLLPETNPDFQTLAQEAMDAKDTDDLFLGISYFLDGEPISDGLQWELQWEDE